MLIQLALMGVLAALLPLTVVRVSGDANKYRKLVWVTAFLTFDLILFGAFTRLTDSGLGCPDWPGCYGHANPFQAQAHIRAAETAMPHGPVTTTKAWIEMIHRYLAMGVGVLILAIMAVAWRAWLRSKRRDRAFAPWLPSFLLVFVCLQGAFGAWTVRLKLQPAIVTAHLLLGMGLLMLLAWLGTRQNMQPPGAQAAALRMPAAIALALLFGQIALGGWVSTNYAALACPDLPLCHGEAVPRMDFASGFALWRALGKTPEGGLLPFPALTAIHWTHRVFAVAVAAFVGWTAWQARKTLGLERLGAGLLAAVGIQCLTGMSTVFLKWPLALAVVHNGGAAALVLLLAMLNHQARSASPTAAPRAATRLSAA